MVTVEHLIELFRNKDKSLRDALESDLITCTDDTVMEDLFPLVASTGFPIPVVDDSGKFLGELCTTDILVSMVQARGPEAEKAAVEETKTDA